MDHSLLAHIKSNEDVKALSPEQLTELADEIRAYMIETVTKTGGHVASSLGAIELTVAINYVFSSPTDSVIYDVGHQAYAHKIINGRMAEMPTLRTFNGISGFPKREESEYDAFNTGHASTSISAAVGMMRANQLLGRPGRAVAVIGDGALGGGMVFEALNDAGQTRTPVIVILNDNGMSISKNTGALSRRLSFLRSSRGYLSFKYSTKSFLNRIPKAGPALKRALDRFKDRIKYFLLPGTLFEELDITYLGPVDGHDIRRMVSVLENVKNIDKPVLVHVITKKGHGYEPAEKMPEKYHGISASEMAGGALQQPKISNSTVFGDELSNIARTEPNVVAITAAMTCGTGLSDFAKEFRARFFDVGIAEQHAVTMAAGMAAEGIVPVVAIYSTFLQRAYDQILHDVCLQRLHVVFAVDRAGLVGEDGETHQGAYDISYLYPMPHMTILSPSTQGELRAMLHSAVAAKGPVAIRYSRGLLPEGLKCDAVSEWKWREELRIAKLTVITAGRMVDRLRPICAELGCGLVNALTIKPLDSDMLGKITREAENVLVIEDGVASCGLGCHVRSALANCCIHVDNIGLPDQPLSHGTIEEQDGICGMLPEQIRNKLAGMLGGSNG